MTYLDNGYVVGIYVITQLRALVQEYGMNERI